MESRPVVWALDAFSKDFDVHFKTAHAIALHAPGRLIHPVYVLSEEVFQDRGYSSFLRPALKTLAHRNMMAVLNHDALWDLRKAGAFHDPEVLIESTADASACALQLLRYADDVNAELIALGTQAKSLMARFFAGSFAESVLSQAHRPVLVIGPHQSRDLHLTDTVVLPTDFQPSHRHGFDGLLEIAQAHDLKLYLLQKTPESIDTWIQNVAQAWGGALPPLEEFYDDDDESRAREAISWIQKAHELGVEAHVVTDGVNESSASAIIDYATQLKDASPTIAMLQDPTNWLTSTVLRDLIRASPFPLYVAGTN